jgi:8-oxo-dGTP diphosphatase
MTHTRPRVAVAAVALVDDLVRPTRLLAARRSDPPELAGGWEFPGGKVEPGESPAQAAVREIREELGVDVELGEPVGDGRPWPIGERHEMWLWWAVTRPGQPSPAPLADHDEVRWLTRRTLRQVAWLANDLDIVAHVETVLEPGAGPA